MRTLTLMLTMTCSTALGCLAADPETRDAPWPLAPSCDDAHQCPAGPCVLVAFFGATCGECSSSADCDAGGCTMGPIFHGGSRCGSGDLGDGCETDADCNGLACGGVVDLLGLVTRSTCGECLSDADCGALQLCAPRVDALTLAGHLACVGRGDLAIGEVCDPEQRGACDGSCAVVDFAGVAEIGVCSECAADSECPAGTHCERGAVWPGTVVPSSCV